MSSLTTTEPFAVFQAENGDRITYWADMPVLQGQFELCRVGQEPADILVEYFKSIQSQGRAGHKLGLRDLTTGTVHDVAYNGDGLELDGIPFTRLEPADRDTGLASAH